MLPLAPPGHLCRPALIHFLSETLIIYDSFAREAVCSARTADLRIPPIIASAECAARLCRSGPSSRQERKAPPISRGIPIEVSTASSLSNLSTASATQTHTSGTAGPNYFSQAEQAESLDQFIAGFHYTPPTEEDEVTMTGDKPVLDGSTSYEPAAPISLSEAPSVSETPAKTNGATSDSRSWQRRLCHPQKRALSNRL